MKLISFFVFFFFLFLFVTIGRQVRLEVSQLLRKRDGGRAKGNFSIRGKVQFFYSPLKCNLQDFLWR